MKEHQLERGTNIAGSPLMATALARKAFKLLAHSLIVVVCIYTFSPTYYLRVSSIVFILYLNRPKVTLANNRVRHYCAEAGGWGNRFKAGRE